MLSVDVGRSFSKGIWALFMDVCKFQCNWGCIWEFRPSMVQQMLWIRKSFGRQNSTHLTLLKYQNTQTALYKLQKSIGFLHFLKLFGPLENNYLKKSQRAESIYCCQELSYIYLSLGSCPSGYTLESGGTKCYILRFPTSVSEVKNWEMIDFISIRSQKLRNNLLYQYPKLRFEK